MEVVRAIASVETTMKNTSYGFMQDWPVNDIIIVDMYMYIAGENQLPVLNAEPVASFSYGPLNPMVGQTISFDASASYDPDGSIVSYFWDFGDGFVASGEQVSHSYSDSGTYQVNLTVIDNDAATNTCTKILNVGSSILMADEISVQDASGSTGDYVLIPVNITNTKNGPIQTICFDISYNHSLINLVGLEPGELTPQGDGWSHTMGSNHESITVTTSQIENAIPNGSTGSIVLLNFSVIGKLITNGAIFSSDFMGPKLNFMVTDVDPTNLTISFKWMPEIGEKFTVPMYQWGSQTILFPYWIWENATEVISFNETNATLKTTPNELHNITLYPFWENKTEVSFNSTVISLVTTPEIGSNFTYYGYTYVVENVTEDTINISVTYGNETQYVNVDRTLTFNRTLSVTRLFSEIPEEYIKEDLENAGYTSSDISPLIILNIDFSNIYFKHGTAPIINGIFQITHWLKGDLDHNGKVADAVDVTMIMQASVGNILSDKTFDLDGNGKSADAVDVTMMIQASVGDIDLADWIGV